MMQFSNDTEVEVGVNLVKRRIFFDVVYRHIEDSHRILDWFYQDKIHDAFVAEFAPKADGLMGVYRISISGNCVQFYYVLECGQHVSDSIDVEDFIDFCERTWNVKTSN